MALGDDKQNKKGLGGGFGLFLVVALLTVMWLQSYFEGQSAKVAFGYQVEHLVNLELLQESESKKTVTAPSLFSISGKFSDALSDSARQRFHYLELLADKNSALLLNEKLEQQKKALENSCLAAADLYLHLSAKSLAASGLVINLNLSHEHSSEGTLVLTSLSKSPIPSLSSLEQEWKEAKDNEDKSLEFAKQLTNWYGYLLSPTLGIANDKMKLELRNSMASLETLEKSKQNLQSIVESSIVTAKSILVQLDNVEEGWRFSDLRAVRDLKEINSRQETLKSRLENIEANLEKQRQLVKGVLWFYNNQELSSNMLEKQDKDEYNQWFERAKIEWDRFEMNRNLPFEVRDQPTSTVLERTFRSQEAPPNYLGLLFTFMPVILVAALIYFMFARQVKGVGSGAMTFGKSPAKLLLKGSHKITFKDVAGIQEAKEELQEIVDFLKDPGKFTALGAEIPKGVLCVGPPGTGKTLVAKAVAGEADRPFFSISGSDFVEMFVGVGASRIRDMFKEAKKQAPCIIFMDEIDAVGRHRGVGIGGGHDEREQTLNQLLVEMDGFEANEGIILMAATNRPDVLDKALLRPGRFDRRVTIDLPDVKGRYEILKLHAKKIKMSDSVDLMRLARATPGGSGADLKNILNEAALRAVRVDHDFVTDEDLDYAADKVRFGKERRSFEMTQEEIKRTAYHEAGHAVVGVLLKHCDPVEKVTVIPRGMALGATYTLPKGNRVGYWRDELDDIMAMIMGGRAAEEIFLGNISSGAQSDISRVSHLARSMICEWGMSPKLGAIAYDERSESGRYLGGSESSAKGYSEETAKMIDEEIRALVQTSHAKALELLNEHKKQVELMAASLVEFETIDAADVEAIMKLQFDAEAKRKKLTEDQSRLQSSDKSVDEETANDKDSFKEDDRDSSAQTSHESSSPDSKDEEPPSS